MPGTALQVRDVPEHRALVNNGPADALRDLGFVNVLVEVAVHGRAVRVIAVHRLQAAHAAVLLQADAVSEEVLARRLGRARQQGAHHYRRSSQSQRFCYMT